jgi:hypothetical protein
MCADCEADEAEPLREVYLARRARMARTWAPRRRWLAEDVAAATSLPTLQRGAESTAAAAGECIPSERSADAVACDRTLPAPAPHRIPAAIQDIRDVQPCRKRRGQAAAQ